jgi:RNA polymerase sigma-54 factor
MQLSQSTQMRTEMRQLLTPRMIQSMEILQLPLMALEERIEQEIQGNPVLELRENEAEPGEQQAPEVQEAREEFSEGEQTLTMKEDASEDFDRLARISDYFENEEFSTNGGSNFRQASYDGERDKKLDAMNNTAARGITLQEHLLGQWAFIEGTPALRAAGEAIIIHIDREGYLRITLEDIQNPARPGRPPGRIETGPTFRTRRRRRPQPRRMLTHPARNADGRR